MLQSTDLRRGDGDPPCHALNTSANRGKDVLILFAYIALSLLMSYPLPLHLTDHIAGRGLDTRVFQWNNWWVKYSLLHRLSPIYTNYIYYPPGVSLLTHNVNWVSSFLAIPLDLLFGPTVAYNIAFLLTLFLSGFGMYLMTRHLVHRRDAAFVAGVIFAFFPYHLSGNWDGQMNLANIQWLPLSALFIMRTLKSCRVRDALAAGLFTVLAALDCWFFAIFLALWDALYVIYALVSLRGDKIVQRVSLLFLSAAVVGALTAPLLVPALTEKDALNKALSYYAEDKSADLVAFFIPGGDHPLLGEVVDPLYDRFSHWRPAFVGYLPLALALVALITVPRRAAFWLFSTLFFASLAMGETLHINGQAYPALPTPYRLLITIAPSLKIIRQPNRFNIMVAFSLAVPVALGSEQLVGRLSKAIHRLLPSIGEPRSLICALMTLVIAFEYLAIPCSLLPASVPPFYHTLAAEPDDTVLLELPLDDFYSRYSLYPQTVHHKRLINGYLARIPRTAAIFIYNNPLLRALRIRMEVDPSIHDIPAEMAVLAANGIRYVVIHTTPMSPDSAVTPGVMAEWQRLFGPDPVYRDAEIIVYKLPPVPKWTPPPIEFADRLTALNIRARRVRLHPGDTKTFLSVDVVWRASRDLQRDYACRLALHQGNAVVVRGEARPIAPHYPTSRWPAGVVVADRHLLPLPRSPNGAYTLSITLLDAASGTEVDAYSLPVHLADAELLVPALADVQTATDVTFGNELRLLGYTPHVEGGRLALDMYWLALRAMDTNYKMFVHLVRPTDDEIVAQHDTMPRDWSYPTSLWSRGEVFRDRMTLNIDDVPPGRYRLAVGVYDPVAGRLPATDAKGNAFPDGRAFISDNVEVKP